MEFYKQCTKAKKQRKFTENIEKIESLSTLIEGLCKESDPKFFFDHLCHSYNLEYFKITLLLFKKRNYRMLDYVDEETLFLNYKFLDTNFKLIIIPYLLHETITDTHLSMILHDIDHLLSIQMINNKLVFSIAQFLVRTNEITEFISKWIQANQYKFLYLLLKKELDVDKLIRLFEAIILKFQQDINIDYFFAFMFNFIKANLEFRLFHLLNIMFINCNVYASEDLVVFLHACINNLFGYGMKEYAQKTLDIINKLKRRKLLLPQSDISK